MSDDAGPGRLSNPPTDVANANEVSARATAALVIATAVALGWIAVAIWGSMVTAPMFEALNYTSSLTQPTATVAAEFHDFLLWLAALFVCAVVVAVGLLRFDKRSKVSGDLRGFKATSPIAIVGPVLGALSFLIYVVVSAYTVVPRGY
jgi:hypothetical protein